MVVAVDRVESNIFNPNFKWKKSRTYVSED